jgi:Skp family chaperone for outer membrane proteins
MMRFGIPALILAAALAATALAGPSAPAGQDGKAAFRLGVVNLKTCFEKNQYERIKDVDAELQKKADEYAKSLRDIEKKILEFRDKLEATPRESPLRAEFLLQMRRLETDLKFEKEYGRAKYLDYYSDRKIEIYNDIRKVVNMIAQEQKFDLVLRVEQPLLEEQDPETVSQRINNRVVLYHHESVDITPLVVKRLNDEWAKTRAAGPNPEWTCKECGRKSRGEACTATPGCKGTKPK